MSPINEAITYTPRKESRLADVERRQELTIEEVLLWEAT